MSTYSVRSARTRVLVLSQEQKSMRPRAGPQVDPGRAHGRAHYLRGVLPLAHTRHTAVTPPGCPVHSVESIESTRFMPRKCGRSRAWNVETWALRRRRLARSAQYVPRTTRIPASAVVKASNAVRAVKSALCSPSSESSIMPGLPPGKPGSPQRPVTPRSTCQVCPLAWVTDIEPTTSSPLDRT